MHSVNGPLFSGYLNFKWDLNEFTKVWALLFYVVPLHCMYQHFLCFHHMPKCDCSWKLLESMVVYRKFLWQGKSKCIAITDVLLSHLQRVHSLFSRLISYVGSLHIIFLYYFPAFNFSENVKLDFGVHLQGSEQI